MSGTVDRGVFGPSGFSERIDDDDRYRHNPYVRRLKTIPFLGIIFFAVSPGFAEAPSLPVRIDLAAGRPAVLDSWRYRDGDQAEWARPAATRSLKGKGELK